jgi:hypothetical protein
MVHVHYRVVQHDGGWAYTLDGAFSEPYRTKAHALRAAHRAAAEQHVPGDTLTIQYQDAAGEWHTELSRGGDRPEADVIA